MIYLKSRRNFQLNSILESELIASPEFMDIIYDIEKDSDISEVFINLFNRNVDSDMVNSPVNFLTIGDDNNTIKFLNSDKSDKLASQSMVSNSYIFKYKVNNQIKIGRITKKILNLLNKEFSDKDIEDFVNKYKYSYNKKYSNNTFEMVSGMDILNGYNPMNYWNRNLGTLAKSCMNIQNGGAEKFWLDLYTDNENVSLLLLKNVDNKILGRSLIWTLTDGSKFMDRIYSCRDSDINTFINYAKSNNWYYKVYQNSLATEPILTPSDDYTNPKNIKMEVKVNPDKDHKMKYFPYLDTMKYFYWETGYLTNYSNNDEYYVGLESDSGKSIYPKCKGDINEYRFRNGLEESDEPCDKCGGYVTK